MNLDYKDIGVIIPVREDSSRIDSKVFLPFADGLNITEWKINQIKEILPSKQIFLSTNSNKLKNIAKNYNINIHDREDYYCTGHIASFSEIIVNIVKEIPYNHIAWVTVCAPLMSPNEYSKAFKKYLKNVVDKHFNDSLVSVNLIKDIYGIIMARAYMIRVTTLPVYLD